MARHISDEVRQLLRAWGSRGGKRGSKAAKSWAGKCSGRVRSLRAEERRAKELLQPQSDIAEFP